MSGSKLKRLRQLNQEYHELIGYSFESYGNGGGFWHRPGCAIKRARSSSCGCGGHWTLPGLDENAGLAIEEADKVLGCWAFEHREDGDVEVIDAKGVRLADARLSKDEGSAAVFCRVVLKALITKKMTEKENR